MSLSCADYTQEDLNVQALEVTFAEREKGQEGASEDEFKYEQKFDLFSPVNGNLSWAPWVLTDSGPTRLLPLHKDVSQFAMWVSPTYEEGVMRKDVIARIQRCVQNLWPEAQVETIGSYKTKLLLPCSDIDLVVFGAFKEANPVKVLFQFARKFEERHSGFSQVITTAKVPIIKLWDGKSGTQVDIAFEVHTGQANTIIVQEFLDQFPLLKPLSLVVKFYLKQRMLNDTWQGGLGSYTVVILITSYLQTSANQGIDINKEENLSALLIGFFEYYGSKFDYTQNGISVRNGGQIFNKKIKGWYKQEQPDLLSVEDPHNPDVDVGSAAFKIQDVKQAFLDAYQLWTERQKFKSNYLEQLFSQEYVTEMVHHREYVREHYRKKNSKPRTNCSTTRKAARREECKIAPKIALEEFPSLSSNTHQGKKKPGVTDFVKSKADSSKVRYPKRNKSAQKVSLQDKIAEHQRRT